jgi:hypothetical protein
LVRIEGLECQQFVVTVLVVVVEVLVWGLVVGWMEALEWGLECSLLQSFQLGRRKQQRLEQLGCLMFHLMSMTRVVWVRMRLEGWMGILWWGEVIHWMKWWVALRLTLGGCCCQMMAARYFVQKHWLPDMQLQ